MNEKAGDNDVGAATDVGANTQGSSHQFNEQTNYLPTARIVVVSVDDNVS
jgi:hypothetical protein